MIPGGPSGAHYTTAYFRHTFSLSNVGELTSLDLEIVRDDGAVVYLNGTEIVRTVMPSGSINYLTRATSTIAGNAEDAWNGFALDPASLVEGTNVIAVEIHQKHPVSSDASMNLRLMGERDTGTTTTTTSSTTTTTPPAAFR